MSITPYSDGWVAAHTGKSRAHHFWDGRGPGPQEWLRGYDDAKAGKIDAKAFLGPDFIESKPT